MTKNQECARLPMSLTCEWIVHHYIFFSLIKTLKLCSAVTENPIENVRHSFVAHDPGRRSYDVLSLLCWC
jgi:hypothetical protein